MTSSFRIVLLFSKMKSPWNILISHCCHRYQSHFDFKNKVTVIFYFRIIVIVIYRIFIFKTKSPWHCHFSYRYYCYQLHFDFKNRRHRDIVIFCIVANVINRILILKIKPPWHCHLLTTVLWFSFTIKRKQSKQSRSTITIAASFHTGVVDYNNKAEPIFQLILFIIVIEWLFHFCQRGYKLS